jgi:hypothetical protein
MTSRTHTPEDVKAIESKYELNIWEKALGWRKRQMIQRQLDPISNQIRNNTLEEVAKEFDKMKNGGDTTAGFAIYIRSMKK